ncbi:hypothetical protein JW796_03665 [Candidatus Dojkabacteria bacterium]|nr:hypothetical protein [Candidatus Dojkabacteria bacterium]
MFNPIIPVYKNLRKHLKEPYFNKPSAREFVEGCIDNFDPDFIVVVDKCDVSNIKLGNRKVISDLELIKELDQGEFEWGVGIYDILHHLLKTELKYKRRKPLEILFPQLNGIGYTKLFLESVFGKLPKPVEDSIRNDWSEALEAKFPKYNLSDYVKYRSDALFTRRLTNLYFETDNPGRRFRENIIFLMDIGKFIDIVDYWNLRALGLNVLPVPIQLNKDKSTITLAEEFIKDNYNKYKNHYGEMYTHVTIQISRSLQPEQSKNFASQLTYVKGTGNGITVSNAFPRIWDAWARDKDGAESCTLEAEEEEYDISESSESLNLKGTFPIFLDKKKYGQGFRVANDLNFRIYSNKELYAEVIPETDVKLARAIGHIGEDDNIRFSRSGIKYYPDSIGRRLYFDLPKGEDVFKEWLEIQGYTNIEVSTPGKIAKQIYKHLGGMRYLGLLSTLGIIGFLNEMSEIRKESKDGKEAYRDSKCMNIEEVNEKLSKIGAKLKFPLSAQNLLYNLVQSKIIELGVEIQCDICSKNSWYELKTLGQKIKCSKCFGEFEIPAYNPTKLLSWAYKTIGPFSLPQQADGAYTVLLTYRFFSQLLDGLTTPLMSFAGEKDGKPFEADLGLFFRSSKYRIESNDVVFAECKTGNDFKQRDIDKMVSLGKDFSKGILVFATLKESLSDEEIKMLKVVVERNRKRWRTKKTYNYIVILTATELLSDWHPEQVWKDKGGFRQKFAHHYSENEELWDATVQIYLGVDSRDEWLHQYLSKKSK